MILTGEHLAILDHTVQRAARGLFCGDSPAMQDLVAAGLMESAGRVAWCPDEYFRITAAGRQAWGAAQPERPKISRRKQRSRGRYEAWLRADSGMSFGDWLRGRA
jgi:hypothetical protein